MTGNNTDRDDWLRQIGVYDEIADLRRQLQEAQQARDIKTSAAHIKHLNDRIMLHEANLKLWQQRAAAAEAQCATQAAALQVLEDYLEQRERLLTAMVPLDEQANLTQFHRLNELEQLRAALTASGKEP